MRIRNRYGRPRELIVRYALLLVILSITVGPLLWQFSSSLKGTGEAIFGSQATFLPTSPTIDAYIKVFQSLPIGMYMLNSLIVCVLSITSQVIFPTMAGYMMSRKGWHGRKFVFAILVISMMFSFESIMVSLFMMTNSFGIVDTLIGVWLPSAISAVNIFIMRAAFSAVPDEVEDAAVLDGANEWQRFFRVYFPAGLGALLVVVINSFVSAWDDFLWPFIVLRSESNFTLTLGLSRLAESSLGFDVRIVMAGSIIAIIPVLIVFIILQRWFYKGVAQGAIK
ncbi:carbohydrate ABC transporter permease [Lysinibacter sp. HNR]|uniref:carbohydrate ABC transporter permease n=1 Tax=Lysinibacter sp. HNR TaxID=3031408 RepID=UPI00243508C9|nr:carbohydrate ABC transporter permease [Lysinibacter sp. HNR]WGD38185.1 carbohydrate ABC transporter permease [Lysinibacter sp. HNR]